MRNLILVVLTVVGLLSVASADEGRFPIYEPTTITAGGHYVLTRSISGSGTILTITVTGTVVTLDLNGFLVSSTGSAPVISMSGDGLVVIRNGLILGGSEGILGGPGTGGVIGGFRVEDVGIANTSGNGIHISDSSSVEILNCEIYDPGAAGIVVVSEVAEISGNFVNSPVTDGIHVSGRSLGGGSVSRVQVLIEDNVVDQNATETGILLEGYSIARVLDNAVMAGTGAIWGISLEPLGVGLRGGAIIQGNTVRGEAGTMAGGIQLLDEGSEIQHNVVSNMGGTGIQVNGSRNLIRRNSSNDNSTGILVTSGNANLIDDNIAQGNSIGIDFSIGALLNYWRNNMLASNTTPVVGGGSNFDAGGNIP